MPKIAKELGPLAVSRLKEQGAHPVGGVAGLYLKIDGGSRSWVLRIVVGHHRRHSGLGPYPAVSLAEARKKAQEIRELVSKGVDPTRQKAAAKAALKAAQSSAITFEQATREYISHHESSWTNAKHASQWLSSLQTWAFPLIGELFLEDLTTSHVLDVLKQPVGDEGALWSVRAETASRVRQRIEKIISAADASAGLDRLNPARMEVVARSLPKVSKVKRVKHHPSLPWQRIPEFMAALSLREGQAAQALAWTLYTAARSGETREMTWSELNLETKIWTVPGSRMKSGREHRVPLTDAAIALLPAKGGAEELVFKGMKGTSFSDMSLSAVIKRMHEDSIKQGGAGWTDPQLNNRIATVHGMRSSFRVWAGDETGHPREVIEAAMAHKVGDAAEQAYARSDLFNKRRQLMLDWTTYCLGSFDKK